MTYNNRRVSSQFANTRTVSYNSGGLNERFSRIVNSQKNKNEQSSTRSPKATQTPANSGGSVFSRLRGSKQTQSTRGGSQNIKNRLGKVIGGGIKKKSTRPTPMSGILKTGSGNKNVRVSGGKRGVVAGKKPSLQGRKKLQQQKGDKKSNKKLTAEDLDRALDSYMMKDPKSAKARLDDDMNAYMAEAEDILMNESL